MTTTDTLTDRELDAWLAEHLFGLAVEWAEWFAGPDGAKRARGTRTETPAYEKALQPFEVGEFDALPNYSSTGDGMLLVLDTMHLLGWAAVIEHVPSLTPPARHGRVSFWRVSTGLTRSVTNVYPLPRAVAEAARLAQEASRTT